MRALRLAILGMCLLLAGCKTDLYSSLSEPDAMEMVALLQHSGIAAERTVAKDGTDTVRVDDARIADAVDLLKRHQLPHEHFASMGEVFQQQGLIASPTEERARYMFALSQELEHTLSEIDGVLSARVHVVLPHNDPLQQESDPAAAAVFLRYSQHAQVADILPQVKMLVANSIQGLSYDKVTVILLPVAPPEQEIVPQSGGLSEFFANAPLGLILGACGGVLAIAGGGFFLWWQRRKPTRANLPAVAAVIDRDPVRRAA